MKILIISNVFPPGFIGGYELGALDVARGLHARHHEIMVLTSDYFLDDEGTQEIPHVIRTLRCPALSPERLPADKIHNDYYSFHNLRTLGSTIRRFDPDLVITFNLIGLGVASIIQYLRKIGMPTILYLMDNIFCAYDIQSAFHKQYERLFGPIELGGLTKVISMSENLVSEVNQHFPSDLEDVIIIPGWARFGGNDELGPLPGTCEVVKFVFCSRISEHKGIHIMIDAVKRLLQMGHCRFTIDVYGAGEVVSLLHEIKASNLDSWISYKGLVAKESMLSLFAGYHVLLFPTWEREPFGFVVSEAAVVGCLSILTAGTGASEWFLDGYDCLKISRNCESLSNAMSKVMSWSAHDMARTREVVLKSGRKNFSFDRWLNVIETECVELARKASAQTSCKSPRGVESSFLFLSYLLRERE
jgi:glycogen synthase